MRPSGAPQDCKTHFYYYFWPALPTPSGAAGLPAVPCSCHKGWTSVGSLGTRWKPIYCIDRAVVAYLINLTRMHHAVSAVLEVLSAQYSRCSERAGWEAPLVLRAAVTLEEGLQMRGVAQRLQAGGGSRVEVLRGGRLSHGFDLKQGCKHVNL